MLVIRKVVLVLSEAVLVLDPLGGVGSLGILGISGDPQLEDPVQRLLLARRGIEKQSSSLSSIQVQVQVWVRASFR